MNAGIRLLHAISQHDGYVFKKAGSGNADHETLLAELKTKGFKVRQAHVANDYFI